MLKIEENRNQHLRWYFASVTLALILSASLWVWVATRLEKPDTAQGADSTQRNGYNPTINPAQFSAKIENQYLSLPVGREFVYETKNSTATDQTTVKVLPDTRLIMGVRTLAYESSTKRKGKLVKYVKIYAAQDQYGNVWRFGADVDNYDVATGTVLDHQGSWLAGEGGALPGIWIKATHVVGDSYRQEYAKGQLEGTTDVVAINQSVVQRGKTYSACVKMLEWTPLDLESQLYQYYCPSVGGVVKAETADGTETTELVSVK